MNKVAFILLLSTLTAACANNAPTNSTAYARADILDIINLVGEDGPYDDSQLIEGNPWPEEERISGSLRHGEKVLFWGEEVVAAVWKSEPGILKVKDYQFDEMVLVLQGTLILTPQGGERKVYKPGDFFLYPKGFTGLWEMPTEYKNLIVVERKAWDR